MARLSAARCSQSQGASPGLTASEAERKPGQHCLIPLKQDTSGSPAQPEIPKRLVSPILHPALKNSIGLVTDRIAAALQRLW